MNQQEIIQAILDKASLDYRGPGSSSWVPFVIAGGWGEDTGEGGPLDDGSLFAILYSLVGSFSRCEFRIRPAAITVKTRMYTYQVLDGVAPRIGVWSTTSTGRETQEDTEAAGVGRSFRWLEETQTHELETT